MEKYCSSCGSVFNDLNFKICPYCGGKLDVRYGRQPIPRKLRHEVFKRDGYRCRECGASKNETILEIDHIIPVAKGGTNDINNLQTLCRECNRMKHTDEWVGGETDLEVVQNELKNLEEQLQKAKEGLNNATNDDEILDCKFKVMKLNDDIDEVKDKLEYLTKEHDEKEKKLLSRQKLDEAKIIAYKKLYINLDKKSINYLSSYFNHSNNKSDLLKHAINCVVGEKQDHNYSISDFGINYNLDSDSIIEEVNLIIKLQINHEEEKAKEEQIKREEKQKEMEKKKQEQIKKENFSNELNYDLNNNSISFLSFYYNVEDKSELIKLLVNNFDSKESIFEFINNLVSEKKYESTKKLLIKSPVHINPLLDEIFDSIGIEINSKEEKIKYLAENYSKKEINVLITKSENRVIDTKFKQIKEFKHKKRKKEKELEIKKQKELKIKKQKELERKTRIKNRIKNYDPSTSKYRVCMNCGYENPKNLSNCWQCGSNLRFQKPIKKELQK